MPSSSSVKGRVRKWCSKSRSTALTLTESAPRQRFFTASTTRTQRSRFGGPLALSKVHWVRPELVAEITYLGWTDEPLLRHTSLSDCEKISRPARFGGK